ncbi:phytanoyl-CoA dioxygenase [uncultured Erythrobacter sp.]|uniref:phytanoyl-CoA dioxygenase n=1 Tax=uncultured Erythrobacter sp. TaxID=263913 RepID=UPI002606047C|nr:phytanoyl-CoA dioxygenase [uncultured Erythrobacter sp.]
MAGRAGELSLAADGAQLYPSLAKELIPAISEIYQNLEPSPGHRLDQLGVLGPQLTYGSAIGDVVASHIGPDARPVRAIAFDKSPGANWSLGWHQDRTICVAEQHDFDGFGPWTRKKDAIHVEPPFSLIEKMLTVRIHLDQIRLNNAPLQIALGSQRCGRIEEGLVSEVVAGCEVHFCEADPGDVWLYSTSILHRSDAVCGTGEQLRRHVLQIDYCSASLPAPLKWGLTA